MRLRPREVHPLQPQHLRGHRHPPPQADLQRIPRSGQGRHRPSVTCRRLSDLKPANIMLSKGVVKIGDFGFAKKNVTKRIKNATSVGTPLYMPLQVLKSEPYTSKCDIWAIGFIFYEMMHNRTPWTAQTEF